MYKLRYKKYIGGLTILLLVTQLYSIAASPNKLCKVYHHRNAHAQTNIELGSFVLYFEDRPIINSLPERIPETSKQHKDQNKTKYTFFLPAVSVNDNACRAMITALNHQKTTNYEVRLQEVSKPIQGIKVIIAYDNNKVNFSYDYYESDGKQRGLIFRFFNKELLEKIGTKNPGLLRTALVKKKPLVVLDFGHGGSDEGAVANAIKEKEITATVGRYVANLLQKQGISVELTRKKDCKLPLDERTYLSSKHTDALLFVSLHANAAGNDKVAGVETYYLDSGLLSALRPETTSSFYHTCIDIEKDCEKLMNNLQTHRVSYREVVLELLNNRCQKSKKLAHLVHTHLLDTVGKKYPIADRRVRPSAYQVLVGSFTPAILIELGFITNKNEATLLKQKEYQQLLADAIAKAICAYIKEC
jgi:N-acetylmuramoyl-L-alanine amidase